MEIELRRLCDHLPLLVAHVGQEGRVRYVNRALEEWLGQPAESIDGRALPEVFGPENATKLRPLLDRARTEGVVRRATVRLEFPRLGARHLQVDCVPDVDAQGTRLGWFVVALDVERLVDAADAVRTMSRTLTERSERRARLNDARAQEVARVAALVEASEDAMVGMATDGRVTHWNPAAERLFGWRRDEAMGQPFMALVPGGSPDPLASALVRVGGGEVVVEEARRRRKDGTVVEASITLAPLRDEGRAIVGAALVARDASGRRRLEADLLQAQKMEAVGRLASGIAHDFRNLLMAVGGCCDLVARNLHNPAVARQYLEEARAAVERGGRLTDQLLAFGRRRPHGRETVLVGDVLTDSENMLRRLIGEDVSLRIRRDPTEPPVSADPSQIEQIVMNLVVNARDAMPNGGVILLRTRAVVFEPGDTRLPADVRPGTFVELTVSDSGMGMSDATRASAFEPFFTTKPVGEGTGLGLTTVYAAVQQAEGFLELESVEGEGTSFRLFFPALRDAVAGRPTLPSPAPDPAPSEARTVLLVEDDPLVRLTVRHYLEMLGQRVLEAVDVKDAIALADAEGAEIDVLVTDMVMPSMSGRELARYLLARIPALRVVYMSAHPRVALEASGRLEAGMPVLQKPFGPEELREAIQRAAAVRKSA